MIRFVVSVLSMTHFVSLERINCHGSGGDWQLGMYESYHENLSWYLTLDCDIVGEAIAANEFELKNPNEPQRFLNSTKYCRYSNVLHKDTIGIGGGDVTTLLNGLPREQIKRTLWKLGETTFGCSAHNYRYPAFADHTHVKLICLYRKQHAEPTCI
uniref:Novel secreted protein 4 n=1 Tax=Heligmosomoides polygyrus bakeri TaxID=375939 RepID=G3C8V6_HELBE|nr:novel secreted protein 4 [Heligmosomoides bakeri]